MEKKQYQKTRIFWPVWFFTILFIFALGYGLFLSNVATHFLYATNKGAQFTPFEAAIADFEALLAGDVAEDGIGGIAAGIVVEDQLIWAKGFGWADTERRIPTDVLTIARTGSISKSFTAVLMVQLAEAGFFDLDDPVADYFPEIKKLADPPKDMKPITFRHLASHTAGLMREPRLDGAASGPIAYWEEKILASIPKTSFLASPDEKYSYSNIGFGILGLAISRAAQKSFMQLMADYIFRPLNMSSSTFILSDEQWSRMSIGYQVRRDSTIDAERPALEHAGRGYKVPNGGIYSTISDLARFVMAVTGASYAQILSQEAREEIQRFQVHRSDSTGYGLGFFVQIAPRGTKVVGHSGSVAGYNAYLCFDPASKIGVILLRNYTRGAASLGKYGRDLLLELVNKK